MFSVNITATARSHASEMLPINYKPCALTYTQQSVTLSSLVFTETAPHPAPCVGHILKMPLIFSLIIDIMPLYGAGLDAQIDHLFFLLYISADSVWACIIMRRGWG